jgi:hypothetical protein
MPDNLEPKCPTCGGENANMLSFIYDLHQPDEDIDTEDSGGIEVTSIGSLKVNYSSRDRQTIRQGGLSKVAEPPSPVGDFVGCVIVALLILGGAAWALTRGWIGPPIGTPLIVLGIGFIPFGIHLFHQGVKKKEKWEKTLLCLDCGSRFIPSDKDDDDHKPRRHRRRANDDEEDGSPQRGQRGRDRYSDPGNR